MKNNKFVLLIFILISQALSQNGAWYEMEPALATMGRGCAITSGGGDSLYVLRGGGTQTFYTYIVSRDTWKTLANVPGLVDTGGAITRVHTCSLYIIRGRNSGDFYLYNSRNNTWQQKASFPLNEPFLPGAALCWAGGDTIYAFKGGGVILTFYKYIISQNQWISIPNGQPRISYYGAGMCWTGTANTFYAIFGGNHNHFFQYQNGIWTSLASPGVNWNAGASLVWDGGAKIYADIGGNTKTSMSYNISNNQWNSIPDALDEIGGNKEGAGLLTWDNRTDQKQLYLIRRTASKVFYRFCLPLEKSLPLLETFFNRQFPPAGWQAKLEQGSSTYNQTDNWQRISSGAPLPDPHPDNVVIGHVPTSDTRKRARLITPKLYLGTRPALVKVQFYMFHNDLGNNDDTLIIEYYKTSTPNPVATLNRKTPGLSGWQRKVILFVEHDTVQISFHCINQEGDAHIFIDSMFITIDTSKLYSNTYLATGVNNSRLLARKPGHSRLHQIFKITIYNANGEPQSQGFLYYSYSDGSDSWSSPILIDTVYHSGDLASNASITTGVFDGKEPWIAYIKATGSIWAAIKRTDGSWKKILLFNAGGFTHEPSMAMGLTVGSPPERIPDLAYLVFRRRLSGVHRVHFFAFDTTGQKYAEQELDQTPYEDPCGQPSVSITPQDLIHIAYLRYESGQNRIYYLTLQNSTNNYQTRTSGVGNWTPRFRVSYDPNMSYLEPAIYPSTETYGNSVFVAWRSKNTNGQDIGEIWRRERILSNPYNDWHSPQNKSQSPSRESHYPVMGTSMVTVFQESTSARNKEIYANIFDNIINISQTDSFSYFPHINIEEPPPPPAPYELKINTIWTERLSNFAYQIKYRRYSYIPSIEASYYTIETGDSTQSPMCLSRDGFIDYPQLPIDYGNQQMLYNLLYLNPNYHYKMKAIVYQGIGGRFRQNFAVDNTSLGSIEYNPNIAETIDIEIPKGTYQLDSRAILKMTKNRGQFVTLAKPLIVYQFEIPETTGSSGSQSTGQIISLTKAKLYQNYPNPFKSLTVIQYSLPTESRVSLKIYNVNGTLIKTLIDQPQKFGIYSINWDGKDNLDKLVSSGIYFYRLETNDYQTTNRALIIR